jgi:hypothetical protein
MLILNALRKGGALSYVHLLPPIKIGKNPTKPRSYDRGYQGPTSQISS